MEIITIPKELTVLNFNIYVYLFRNISWNENLVFMFDYLGYFVYYNRKDFEIRYTIDNVKKYIINYIESKKENDKNNLNISKRRRIN